MMSGINFPIVSSLAAALHGPIQRVMPLISLSPLFSLLSAGSRFPIRFPLSPPPHPPPTPALDERLPEYHHLLYLSPLGAPRCTPDLGCLTRPRFTPAPAAGTRLASGSGGRRGRREDSIGGYWLGAVAGPQPPDRPRRVVSTALSLSLSISLSPSLSVSLSRACCCLSLWLCLLSLPHSLFPPLLFPVHR